MYIHTAFSLDVNQNEYAIAFEAPCGASEDGQRAGAVVEFDRES